MDFFPEDFRAEVFTSVAKTDQLHLIRTFRQDIYYRVRDDFQKGRPYVEFDLPPDAVPERFRSVIEEIRSRFPTLQETFSYQDDGSYRPRYRITF
jgi:hypothetical protein